ncbi:Bro-N domain-containing protein [Streptomyces sp. ID05-39B]|uniref:BRO-N domain-containing protein n=1 Tax=Streptomyces sp. ID05-39B TaxID=3028664 RepID=UPI0029BD3D97|nr:Bro-N domain-containing protein [Streptomyces sp. ID05-39B]MDX3527964.1 Bro-N domain-containing protein [Streptomyces sp. ID05-39B]
MYEQNNTPPDEATTQRDAIDINDFVFAATGARVRRLTTPDGTHWFPAVDVCRNLGYSHVGSALRNIADMANFASVESVLLKHTLGIPAGREWRRDMNLVNLPGLIRLVNGCTKPESQPFKVWVSEVIERARSRKNTLRLRALSYVSRSFSPAGHPRTSRGPPESCPGAPSGSRRTPAGVRHGCS